MLEYHVPATALFNGAKVGIVVFAESIDAAEWAARAILGSAYLVGIPMLSPAAQARK